MCDFEKKVQKSFDLLNISLNKKIKIGAAVSGGADSVALLISLVKILSFYSQKLYVITVNHNIRSEEETCGDALFVEETCQTLQKEGYEIEFSKYEINRGVIEKTAKDRKCGIEESARFFRYEAFEKFIDEKQLDYLCLAHNQNDQLETLLMRFLQGGTLDSLTGIKMQRDKYLRPLLNVNREEIENYLNERNIFWRTDSTNFDTKYLRNKIRLKLIPLLNEEFSGWKTAVSNSIDHFTDDYELIENIVNDFEICSGKEGVYFGLENFKMQYKCIQSRIIKKAANLAGESKRIPAYFIDDVLKSIANCSEKSFVKYFDCIKIDIKKDTVFIKKTDKCHTELSFFDIIEESGTYDFPFGKLYVSDKKESAYVEIEGCSSAFYLGFPFIVRNIQLDDYVVTADLSKRKISEIYSDWHVLDEDRFRIPIFQELNDGEQNIKGIIGSFLGYKDWIVRV